MQKRSVALSQHSIRTTARFFYLGKDTRIKTECASWLGRVSHQRLRIFQGTPQRRVAVWKSTPNRNRRYFVKMLCSSS
jgi:hypothetical protein